jgi:gamma-glutamyltranspeptidase/glutathione hydrolase
MVRSQYQFQKLSERLILLPLAMLFYSNAFAQQKIDTARFMVATAHPLATKAGMNILAKGGNAFDAITASAFMLAVVEPSMSGIGGRLQAVYHKADGKNGGIDATTQVPVNYKPTSKEEENGFGTVGVPGMVKGILELHTKHGKLPLKLVMNEAMVTAKNGFVPLKEETQRMASVSSELKKYTVTRQLFLGNDSTPVSGSMLKQKSLARTLQKISKDKGKSFYQGKEAKRLAEQITSSGGFLSISDMTNYVANNGNILLGNYRGYEVLALGMPSYGAIAIEMLHLLEQEDLSACSESAFMLHHANAHKKAYEDRKLLRTKEDLLVDKNFARERWKDSTNIGIAKPEDAADGHTTHLVASDADGNVVSLTQSLGPIMGSKVASQGGYMLATTMGPYLGGMKPGERASSHIAPVLVMKNGVPVLALGAAGGARIVPAVVQVISRFIDQQLALDKALAAARIFHLGDRIQVENHPNIFWKDGSTIKTLKRNNNLITEIKQPALFGRVHAVYRLPTGEWVGAADPDWTGTAGNF